jgi:hypothetical protein
MKIFEIEIERTYTALVAAEDKESARKYASRISDRIVRECGSFGYSEHVWTPEALDLKHIEDEPVYCDNDEIQSVKDVREVSHGNA